MFELTKYILARPFLMLLLAGVTGGLAKVFLPLALISCALLGVYVLRKGSNSGIGFMVLSAVMIYLIGLGLGSRPGLDYPVTLLLMPVVFLSASVLRVSESQGLAVALIGFLAAFMVIFIQLYSGNAVAFWEQWLSVAIEGVQGATVSGFENNGSLQIMNGLMAVLFAVASIASVLLSRWLQALAVNPGGFKPEFEQLLLPPKLFTFYAIAIGFYYFIQESVMLDLLLVSAVIYSIQGLAIFHHGATKKGHSNVYLLPPYLALLFIPLFAVVGLACVGMSDLFLHYRQVKK